MDYQKFLDMRKAFIGFGNYEIILEYSDDLGTSLASTAVDNCEYTLTITISNEVPKFSIAIQTNILLHELVHARVALNKMRIEATLLALEEEMVNDITKLVEMRI